MYCAYLGRDHDSDECYHCDLGALCAGVPARLILQAQRKKKERGLIRYG